MLRLIFIFLAGLVLCAQTPIPGFPPGTFQNRAAIDAGSAVTPVAFNQKSLAVTITGSTCAPCNKTNMTVTGTASTALIGVIMLDASNPGATAVSMTWDSAGTPQSMTPLGSCAATGGFSGIAYIFGLRAPHAGNLNMTVSWTGSTGSAYWDAVQFDNVNQANDAAAFPVAGQVCNTATSTSPSVTIPTGTTHAVVSLFNIGSGGGNMTSPSDTLIFNSGAGAVNNAAAQYKAPSNTASAVMSGTIGNVLWSVAGVDIAP